MSSAAFWQKEFRHPLGSFVKSMCSNWSTPSRDCEVSARLGVAVWRPLTDGGEALFVYTDLTSQFSSSWCRASRTFFSSSWPAGKVWCFQSIQPSAIFLNQVTHPDLFFRSLMLLSFLATWLFRIVLMVQSDYAQHGISFRENALRRFARVWKWATQNLARPRNSIAVSSTSCCWIFRGSWPAFEAESVLTFGIKQYKESSLIGLFFE